MWGLLSERTGSARLYRRGQFRRRLQDKELPRQLLLYQGLRLNELELTTKK